jgi:hypothetical protein
LETLAMNHWEKVIFSGVLILLIALTASGQTSTTPQADQAKARSDSKQQTGAGKKSTAAPAPVLLDLKPVSTTEAAESAAREMAKRRADSKGKSGAGPSAAAEPAVQSDQPAVGEFKPVLRDDSSDAVVVKSEDSKKSVIKNVHGTAAGSLDPQHRGNHQAAAAAGASSKSGKTSVYVETDSSRAVQPPH